MVSNRVKRNVWGAFSIIGLSVIAGKVVDCVMGNGAWYHIVWAVTIFFVVFRMFLGYRKVVKEGNIYGRVNVWGDYPSIRPK